MRLRLALVQFTDGPLNDINGLETDRITSETLEPLLAFPILVDLRVSYHRQFQLDEYHLVKLLEGWRDLECLCLCSDPLLEEVPILPPTVLYLIAWRCPRLRLLKLYLNTCISPHHDRFQPVYFQSLEAIEFGTSPLASEGDFPQQDTPEHVQSRPVIRYDLAERPRFRVPEL